MIEQVVPTKADIGRIFYHLAEDVIGCIEIVDLDKIDTACVVLYDESQQCFGYTFLRTGRGQQPGAGAFLAFCFRLHPENSELYLTQEDAILAAVASERQDAHAMLDACDQFAAHLSPSYGRVS